MLSFAEGAVGEAEALALLGVVPLASYMHVLESVAALDRATLMEEVHRVVSLGVDIPRLRGRSYGRYPERSAAQERRRRSAKYWAFSTEETAGLKALSSLFSRRGARRDVPHRHRYTERLARSGRGTNLPGDGASGYGGGKSRASIAEILRK
jgi:hypothetical protein